MSLRFMLKVHDYNRPKQYGMANIFPTFTRFTLVFILLKPESPFVIYWSALATAYLQGQVHTRVHRGSWMNGRMNAFSKNLVVEFYISVRSANRDEVSDID